MHHTSTSLEYSSAQFASHVERAVAPEVGEIAGDRTTVTVERVDRTLEVTVQATDPVALRAGLNTWLGFLTVAETVAETADRFEDRIEG